MGHSDYKETEEGIFKQNKIPKLNLHENIFLKLQLNGHFKIIFRITKNYSVYFSEFNLNYGFYNLKTPFCENLFKNSEDINEKCKYIFF